MYSSTSLIPLHVHVPYIPSLHYVSLYLPYPSIHATLSLLYIMYPSTSLIPPFMLPYPFSTLCIPLPPLSLLSCYLIPSLHYVSLYLPFHATLSLLYIMYPSPFLPLSFPPPFFYLTP